MEKSPAADLEQRSVDGAPAVPVMRPGRRPARNWLKLGAGARGALWAAAVFAISRLVVYVAMGVAGVIKGGAPVAGLAASWDGAWYMALVRSGYPTDISVVDGVVQPTTVAFFPLFPFMVRAVSAVPTVSDMEAALAINAVFGIASAVGLWFLVRDVVDSDTADRAVALYSFFPGTFVLSMAYSEPVMLAPAVACLWALHRRRWVVAGLTAGVATAARASAVALCLCCAFAAFQAIRKHREWRALVAPALSPLGLVAFSGYLWAHTGDALAWVTAQRGWGRRFDFGQTMARFVWDTIVSPGDLNKLITTLTVVFVGATLVLLARWRPPGVLALFAAGVIAINYFSPSVVLRPRFAMTAFPLVVVPAVFCRRAGFHALLGGSAVLLGALTIISLTTVAVTP